MQKVKQLRLFETITNYDEIRNMGMVISVNYYSKGAWGCVYKIRLNKNILNHVSIEKLKDIIDAKFHGYYGGHIKINVLTDCLFIDYDAWND